MSKAETLLNVGVLLVIHFGGKHIIRSRINFEISVERLVDHGNGYTSLYGHLQKATVKQGETVSAGQQVGVIGSTGNSSGPHLHLRVRKNGQSIDPRTVIPGYK